MRNAVFCLLNSLFGVLSALGPPDTWSEWTNIKAYDNPEVDIPHELGELPMKVEVQVKVSDSQLGDIIFIASGSVQQPTDPTENYGGVIYKYNSQYVKVMAPGPTGCTVNCNGGIVYLGGGGYNGLTPGVASGLYREGQVRVRAWKMCTFSRPTKIVDLVGIESSVGFLTIPLTATSKFDMVLVKVNLDDDWITDALGTVSFNSVSSTATGVVYAFDGRTLDIKTPRQNSGESVHSTVNWGSGANDVTLTSATIRVFAWKFNSATPIKVTKSITVTPSSTDIYQMTLEPNYDPTTPNISVTVEANAYDLPDEDDWSFPITGSAVTSGQDSSISYGSVFYGFNDQHVMFWTPSRPHGCSLQMSQSWGDGTKTFCTQRPSITIRYFETTDDDLPCDTKGCSGTEAGPFCECGGTGFESQFCEVPVKCPTLTAGIDYINSSLEWVDTNGDGEYSFSDGMGFTCLHGYQYFSGNHTRYCTVNKTWSGEPFTCEPVPCNTTPEPATFGFINGSYESYFGSVVYYACSDTYAWKTGDMERTCGADGQWNGTAPTCDKSCGEPDSPVGAHRTNLGITEGVVAQYQCNKGHEYLSGDMERACLIGGTWNGTAPVCQRVSCDRPLSGSESTLQVDTYLYSDAATYTCTLGYEDVTKAGNQHLVTTRTVYCQETKQWSNGPLSCTKIKCAVPTPTSQSYSTMLTSVSGIEVEYGLTLTFQCNTGYGLAQGSLTLTCQADRTWTDVYPVCEIKSCDMPDNTTNATTIVTGLTYLSRVIVVCDDNFYISSGQAQRYCNENGQWEGQKPECEGGTVVFVNPNVPNTGGGGQGTSGGSSGGGNSSSGADPSDLRVRPKDTVRYKQSLYSPYDATPSHVAIGVTGVIVMLAVLGYICSLDYIRHIRVGGKVKVIHGMKQNPYAVESKTTTPGKTSKEKELKDLENVEHVYT